SLAAVPRRGGPGKSGGPARRRLREGDRRAPRKGAGSGRGGRPGGGGLPALAGPSPSGAKHLAGAAPSGGGGRRAYRRERGSSPRARRSPGDRHLAAAGAAGAHAAAQVVSCYAAVRRAVWLATSRRAGGGECGSLPDRHVGSGNLTTELLRDASPVEDVHQNRDFTLRE